MTNTVYDYFASFFSLEVKLDTKEVLSIAGSGCQ